MRVFGDSPLQHLGNLLPEPVVTQHRILLRHRADVGDLGIIDLSCKERRIITPPLQVVITKTKVQTMRPSSDSGPSR